MIGSGRIERRLAAAIVLTALIPLLAAVYLAQSAVERTSERFFLPEVGARLDESLGLYQELARADKAAMRARATAIAANPDLALALKAHDVPRLRAELSKALAKNVDLVSLAVVEGDSRLAAVDRGRPVDATREATLELRKAIFGADGADEDGGGAAVVAVFAADRSRYDGLERMSAFVAQYANVAGRRKSDERAYLLAFGMLLGLTIVGAIGVGATLARSVSTRIVRLADATRRVGAGDLSIRVDESSSDEVGDLARAFNRMLGEVEASRARIEYLNRIGVWQEMARRLAHEIKNPLTPIQLAVEEIHQRYSGGDGAYQKALDATLQVVQAEVGTLRRLVGEFSDFARLPEARLEPADLAAFLREHSAEADLVDDRGADGESEPKVAVTFEVPDGEAKAHLDVHMMRRVIANLVRNSAQAIRDQKRAEGKVAVTLGRDGDFWVVDVDDDGPGIPPDLREKIFDPYVTTKGDGTGLGLAIVKKIVVEHGGSITAREGPLGGARLRITIPVRGSAAARAVLHGLDESVTGLDAGTPAPSPAARR